MKLVAKLRLVTTAEQAAALLATVERFNAACEWLAGKAFAERTANKFLLQRRYYGEIRSTFELSAQMAVRVIAKVCEVYKRDKAKRPHFKPRGAIVYDQRLCSFKSLDRVSLLTLTGRQVMPYLFGEYQRPLVERLKGQADLVYGKGVFYLYATADIPTPDSRIPDGVLGVDLGIKTIAATSDGELFAGGHLNGLRRRYARLRQRLQKKGTRSAKRLIRHRRGKERRFQADTNHTISKRIVETASTTNRAIGLEDLEGIRTRVKAPRDQRRVLHGWAFHQFRAFVTYKAQRAGVVVLAVDPSYTSQTCPACGHIDRANRKSQADFLCTSCGLAGHADYIASLNIQRRAAVMLPHVSVLSRQVEPGSGHKLPASAGSS